MLRPGLIQQIYVDRKGWGSWEALLVVPPGTVVWAIHEIGLHIVGAVVVRVGRRGVRCGRHV